MDRVDVPRNPRSFLYRTPVHEAAEFLRVSLMEMLLTEDGDPQCEDLEGFTPLHLACRAQE